MISDAKESPPSSQILSPYDQSRKFKKKIQIKINKELSPNRNKKKNRKKANIKLEGKWREVGEQ